MLASWFNSAGVGCALQAGEAYETVLILFGQEGRARGLEQPNLNIQG